MVPVKYSQISLSAIGMALSLDPQRGGMNWASGPIQATVAYWAYTLLKNPRNNPAVIANFCWAMLTDLTAKSPGQKIYMGRLNINTMFCGPLAKYVAFALKDAPQEALCLPKEWIPKQNKTYSERVFLVETGGAYIKQQDENNGEITSRDPEMIYCKERDCSSEATEMVDFLIGCLSKPRKGKEEATQLLHETTTERLPLFMQAIVIEKLRHFTAPWYTELRVFDDGKPTPDFARVFQALGVEVSAWGFPQQFYVRISWPLSSEERTSEIVYT